MYKPFQIMALSDPSSPPFPLSIREFVLHAALLVLPLVVLMPRVFLHGEIALPGDALYAARPWSGYTPKDYRPVENVVAREALMTMVVWNHAAERALRGGEWPLWNPYQLTGTPLLANYQSAIFYPPRLLFHMLDFYSAATAYLLLKLGFAGITAYFFGRVFGLGPAAARFLSFAWMLSGYLITWVTYTVVDVCAWLPLLMASVEWILARRFRAGFYLLSLSATLMLLAGHPETAFTAAAGTGIYMFLRLAFDTRDGRRPWCAMACAGSGWMVSLLVCGAMIAPLLEYLPNSYTLAKRAAGEAQMQFLRPDAFVSIWVQRFFGFSADGNFWGGQGPLDNSNFTGLLYPGVIVWLGVAGLFATRKVAPELKVRLISLGVPSVLFLLYCFDVPFLKFIRLTPLIGHTWGIHYLPFPMFVLALLGAVGMQRWFEEKRRDRDILRLAPILAVAVLATFLVYRFHAPYLRMAGLHEYMLRQFGLAAVLAMAGLVPMVLHRLMEAPRALASAFTVMLAVDLCYAAHDMIPTCSRARLYPETELTRFLRSQPQPCRVDASPLPEIRPGYLTRYDIETLWGYDGIYPARILRVLEQSATPSWRSIGPACSIDFYLQPEGALDREEVKDRLKWAGTIDGIDVFENLEALPRARLVGRVLVVSDADRLFERCAEPDFDPRTMAITESPPRAPLPPTAEHLEGTAAVVSRSSGRVVIDAEAGADCVLVVADAYYPGWRAYVDSTEVEVFPVYHAFRGVVLPEGKHRVEFRMQPRVFRFALGVSSFTLLTSAVVAAVHLVRLRAAVKRKAGAQ